MDQRNVSAVCPMCLQTPVSPGERVAWDHIWSGLEAEFEVTVPQETRRLYEIGEATELVICATCGLRFFSPAIPGGPDFYALLDSDRSGYYNESTWDGSVVASLLSDEDDVVDFGCGDGALLRSLPVDRPGRVVGVDHNAGAIAALRAAGLEGSTDEFQEFARRHSGSFDVACAMQILEHVPDVAPLVEACRDAVRPGGRIFIAVPNDERERDRFEPLDCPPHHLSRWATRDLTVLAEKFDLRVVNFYRQQDPVEALRRTLERCLPGGGIAWLVSRVAARLVPTDMANAALARWWPETPTVSFAMVVELVRPPVDSSPI